MLLLVEHIRNLASYEAPHNLMIHKLTTIQYWSLSVSDGLLNPSFIDEQVMPKVCVNSIFL